MTEGMIEVRISRSFPALQDSAGFDLAVEFEAPAGITVLFGPSGSGKTLTLDSIAGFVQPDAGRITAHDRLLFDAEARLSLPARERDCGYVFQSYALFPHMTVRENLAFAAHRLPRLERHRRIADSLDRFRLTELAGRYPRQLSGGQKQRASIARALIGAPKMLLLDEPGRGLDASLRDDLFLLIQEMKKSLHIPVLLVTHDPEECFALGDRIMLYEAGRIVQRGAPLDLLRNPGTTAAAKLLGNFNLYDAEILTLDPARQTSRVRLLGCEMEGPHLRGCFRGDRVTLAARPEELRIAEAPGENRIRAEIVRVTERAQALRVDFGEELVVDVSRDRWNSRGNQLWVEIPRESLRLLSRV